MLPCWPVQCILVLVLLIGTQVASGTNYEFSVPFGFWQNETCWTPQGVPGRNDSATIRTAEIVALTGENIIVNALTLVNGAELNATFSTITVENLIVNGTLILITSHIKAAR